MIKCNTTKQKQNKNSPLPFIRAVDWVCVEWLVYVSFSQCCGEKLMVLFVILKQCLLPYHLTFLLFSPSKVCTFSLIGWRDCDCCLNWLKPRLALLSPVFSISLAFLAVASCPRSAHLFLLPSFLSFFARHRCSSLWVLIYESPDLLMRVILVWSPASEWVDFKPIKQQKRIWDFLFIFTTAPRFACISCVEKANKVNGHRWSADAFFVTATQLMGSHALK